MLKKIKWVFILLTVVFFIALTIKNLPCSTQKNFHDYYSELSRENIYAVIENNYDFDYPLYLENENVYLPAELIRAHIDKYIFYDEPDKVIITTADKIVKLTPNTFDYFVNDRRNKLRTPIRKINSRFYLPSDFLQEMYDLEIAYKKKYNLVTIDFNKKSHSTGKIKSTTPLRYSADKKSPIAEKISKGSTVKIYNVDGKYTKVRNENGLLGYVKTKKITNRVDVSAPTIPISNAAEKKSAGKIKMVWEQIANRTANYYALQKKIPTALNVISPTWFSFDMEKMNGDLINLADIDYVNKAHKNNCEVWALISDNFNSKVHHFILADYKKRDHVIKQLIDYADEYNLDGINVDFEAVAQDDAQFYLQFLRELSVHMREKNLTLSVDMFVPQAYSMYYNRKEVAKIADYICLMAYDEYDMSSKTAGPVASYEFVANGIKKTLKQVPAEKVLLGIPFYTRIWRESSDGISAQNISMSTATEFFNKRGVKLDWLDIEKYFYGEYETFERGEKVVYKSWLENEKSVEEKLKLAQKFNLAGVCGWRKNFENARIWTLIDEYN